MTDYPIVLESAAFEHLNAHLRQADYSNIYVLVDDQTEQHCLPILQRALEGWALRLLRIPAGEAQKHLGTCQVIWQQLLAAGADRRSVLLNLGGGVIGDMGGFCAATFKRGMDFIQIPTTLLAQVDASVGGKLGVNFGTVKNSVGLFEVPQGVYVHTPFFKTLSPTELRSGYAEVIKHALIQDQAPWQSLLPDDPAAPDTDWDAIVLRSIAVKKRVVEQDFKEQHWRKCLNFGHTIGHAVESLSWKTDQPLPHGYAVALGMMTESYCSTQLGTLAQAELQAITHYITQWYPHYPIQHLSVEAIWQLMTQDKKNTHQRVAFSGLAAIGQPALDQPIDPNLLQAALTYYNDSYGRK